VDGAVVRPFAPEGPYGGHWGVDLASTAGSPVNAAGTGSVTFAGPVAGRLSVTIYHGGEVRTSYSYLSSVSVPVGRSVEAGDLIGFSGLDHGAMVVHFSLRVGAEYVSPPTGRCPFVPADGLRLGW